MGGGLRTVLGVGQIDITAADMMLRFAERRYIPTGHGAILADCIEREDGSGTSWNVAGTLYRGDHAEATVIHLRTK